MYVSQPNFGRPKQVRKIGRPNSRRDIQGMICQPFRLSACRETRVGEETGEQQSVNPFRRRRAGVRRRSVKKMPRILFRVLSQTRALPGTPGKSFSFGRFFFFLQVHGQRIRKTCLTSKTTTLLHPEFPERQASQKYKPAILLATSCQHS